MNEELFEEAKRIACFLSSGQTDAGVADPDEGQVLRHSYTTEYFAWCCALLYRCGYGDEWLRRAVQATQSALALIADEGVLSRPSRSAQQFHWEFKNLALVNVHHLIGGQLPEALRLRLQQTILAWRNLNIDSTNWMAMRALSYQMRNRLFGRKEDRLRSGLELGLVLNQQTPEGFFPDTPHSHSMQYHAYVLSLLALSHRVTNRPRVRDALLRGVRLVADFVNPAGDFNYYGRGQRQLFGYASLILALSEAAGLCTDAAEAARYDSLVGRILQFIREHRCPDGVFPVVMNHCDGRWGWYDYNNRGDYLAFSGVWFLLSAAALKKKSATELEEQVYTRFYPGLGLAVASRPEWFASFSAGGDDLSEPVGLIHLWPSGPFCLGGPEPARAMGADYHWNYYGPLVDEQPVLQQRWGKMSVDSDAVHISFSLPDVKIRQTYRWGSGLVFEQEAVAERDGATVTPLFISDVLRRPGNLHFQALGTGPSPTGLGTQFKIDAPQEAASPSSISVELATGADLPPEKRSVQIIHGRLSRRRSIWRRVLKAIWVLWVKITV